MSVHDTTEPTATTAAEPDATTTDEPRGFDRGHDIEDSDDVFDAIDQFLDDLEDAATDEEQQEVIQDYLDKVSDLSLWEYSFNNQAALLSQMAHREVEYARTESHFAGYRQWQDKGRQVEEGETGYRILAPVMGLTCPECGNAPNYHTNDWLDCERAGTDPDEWDIDPEEHEEWTEGVLYFKTVSVFAYAQTKPQEDADEDEVFTPMDTEATGENGDELLAAAKGAARDEFDITVNVESPEGYTGRNGSKGYTRLSGTVNVLGRENAADTARTLIHEIAHELIHGDDGEDDDVDREKREVEAECVAYAVCRYFGLDASGSALYVGRWNGDDRDELKGRMRRIRRTAADVIEAVDERME